MKARMIHLAERVAAERASQKLLLAFPHSPAAATLVSSLAVAKAAAWTTALQRALALCMRALA